MIIEYFGIGFAIPISKKHKQSWKKKKIQSFVGIVAFFKAQSLSTSRGKTIFLSTVFGVRARNLSRYPPGQQKIFGERRGFIGDVVTLQS